MQKLISCIVLSQSKRDHFAYYASQPKEEIGMMALRYKNFKAHFYTKGIKSTLKRYAQWSHEAKL